MPLYQELCADQQPNLLRIKQRVRRIQNLEFRIKENDWSLELEVLNEMG